MTGTEESKLFALMTPLVISIKPGAGPARRHGEHARRSAARRARLHHRADRSGALLAQSPNPLIAEQKPTYTGVKTNLIKAAEKMPEDAYSFKPTPEVQSFGQRIAHIANQIGTCSSLTGERKQSDANNKTATA